MVLNALPIERPISKPHGQYRLFTPENFFTPKVEAIKTRTEISKRGMTLDQTAQVLAIYPIEVTRHYAKPNSIAEFREILETSLQRPNETGNSGRAGLKVESCRATVGQKTSFEVKVQEL